MNARARLAARLDALRAEVEHMPEEACAYLLPFADKALSFAKNVRMAREAHTRVDELLGACRELAREKFRW